MAGPIGPGNKPRISDGKTEVDLNEKPEFTGAQEKRTVATEDTASIRRTDEGKNVQTRRKGLAAFGATRGARGAAKKTVESRIPRMSSLSREVRDAIMNAEPKNLRNILEDYDLRFDQMAHGLEDFKKPENFAEDKLKFPEGTDESFFYDLQFGGESAEEEFLNFINNIGLFPIEVVERNDPENPDQSQKVEMKWLNQDFVDTYLTFEQLDPETTSFSTLNPLDDVEINDDITAEDYGEMIVPDDRGAEYLDLVQLPANIGRFANLEILEIPGHFLTGLPSGIGEMAKLHSLDVTHNELTGLSDKIISLPSLTSLRAKQNNLSDEAKQEIKETFQNGLFGSKASKSMTEALKNTFRRAFNYTLLL